VAPRSTTPGEAFVDFGGTLVFRRVITMSLPGPPLPATTILPSAAIVTAIASSAPPPKSTVCLASPEKLVSGVPSAFNRTIAKSPPVEPTTTSLPSGCATVAFTVSVAPKSTTAVPAPAPANVVSRVPLAFSRLITKSRVALPRPATTIRSSPSTTTPAPMSSTPACVPSDVLPPDPKVLSGAPPDVSRATAKSPLPVASVEPTITIRPSGAIATWVARSAPPKLSVCLPPAPKAASRSPGAARATELESAMITSAIARPAAPSRIEGQPRSPASSAPQGVTLRFEVAVATER
jgi:hypothetical protein